MTWMHKVCVRCPLKNDCLINGLPSEEKLQKSIGATKRVISLPKGCPLTNEVEIPERVIFT